MVGLDLLGSLLPMAGAGASGFMEGQQQAIAANQAKQAMYLAEQEERRRQALFPKQIRSLDQAARAADQDYEFGEEYNPLKIKAAQLPLRPNVPGLNPEIAEGLGVQDPNNLSATTFEEQLGLLTGNQNRKAGIYKATTPRGSNNPTRRLEHLERMYKQFTTNPPKNVNEVIVAMDDDMRATIKGTAAAQTVEAALAYYAQEIENERKRLGMGNNQIAPKAQTMDSIFNKYMPTMPKK